MLNYLNIGDIILADDHNKVFAGSLVSFSSPTYNDDGNLLSATINGRAYEFTYNDAGLLTQAKDTKYQQDITYDDDGRVSTITTTAL